MTGSYLDEELDDIYDGDEYARQLDSMQLYKPGAVDPYMAVDDSFTEEYPAYEYEGQFGSINNQKTISPITDTNFQPENRTETIRKSLFASLFDLMLDNLPWFIITLSICIAALAYILAKVYG
ncbi:MAG: hypothetical protein KC421_02440 [Anaerolineales bacterium]|nr:hypothetical protein [Anaerolineales bacterium]